MKEITFNNTIISYRVFGNGNPLVFLHGFLEDASMWDEFIQPLKNTNQLILIDLPCHGKTRFVGEICSMTFMAKCVQHILKYESIKSPTILGHSMGGYVGLELAKITDIRLILIHSNFWTDSNTQKGDRDKLIELVKEKKGFFIKVAIPNLFHENNKMECSKTITNLIDKANQIPAEEICSATLGLKTRHANYGLLKEQDITIIQGEFDPIMTLNQMTIEIESIQSEQKIHLIKDCGHMSIWEKPKELLDIIQQLCE